MATDEEGYEVCAIHIAVRHDALDSFFHLHSRGARSEVHTRSSSWSYRDVSRCCDNQAPPANAAFYGQLDCVVMLLEAVRD